MMAIFDPKLTVKTRVVFGMSGPLQYGDPDLFNLSELIKEVLTDGLVTQSGLGGSSETALALWRSKASHFATDYAAPHHLKGIAHELIVDTRRDNLGSTSSMTKSSRSATSKPIS